MADPAPGLVEHFADGILQAIPATHIAHDREAAAVRRPVRPLHVFEQLSRRPTRQRGAGQRAHIHPGAGAMAVEGDGHFARGRNRQQLGMLQPERPRFSRSGACAEDFYRIALPRGAVQDGLAVRSKSRRANVAAPERDLVISRVGYGQPPKWFPGEQSGSRSHQQSNANQNCGEFVPSPRARRSVVTFSRDERLRGGTDSGAGRIGVTLQSLEIGPQLRGSLAAQLAVLLQSLVEYGLQLRRQPWVQLDWRCGYLVQNRFKDDG